MNVPVVVAVVLGLVVVSEDVVVAVVVVADDPARIIKFTVIIRLITTNTAMG